MKSGPATWWWLVAERPAVLTFNDLTRSFGRSESPVLAVREASGTIYRGDYVAITGPSGSGKSTLLTLLGLLDTPTSGDLIINDLPTSGLTGRGRARLRASSVGFVFQSFHLLNHLTSVENVMIGDLYVPDAATRRVRRQRSEQALTTVGLGHRLDARPPTLSGGEQQRVAIARALVSEPDILLCDEPTGNLDQSTGASVLATIEALVTRGSTVVVVTHDMDIAAAASRVLTMRDGLLAE